VVGLRLPLLPWWVRWAAVAGLAAFIFYASIVTVPPETVLDQVRPGPEALLPLDKWRHFLAYATFGYALAYQLPTGRSRHAVSPRSSS
jgi:hypothetical protein